MPKGIYHVPKAVNEPIKAYTPGSPERASLQKTIEEMRASQMDIPMIIGGKEVRTKTTVNMAPPHDHKHSLGHFHKGDKSHVQAAIDAALKARSAWA